MMYDRILKQCDTEYGELSVTEIGNIRYLVCDGYMQSALDLNDHTDLVFPYMQRFSYAFAVNPAIRNTLMIGGGAFSYPRYYLERYEGKIRVIEINEKVIELADAYFEAEKLRKTYGERFSVVCDDAMSYLHKEKETYDLIINDAFIGKKKEGIMKEDVKLIHSHLNENGICMINVASALKGIRTGVFRKLQKILRDEFAYVAVLQCEEDRTLYEKQNILLIASDRQLI